MATLSGAPLPAVQDLAADFTKDGVCCVGQRPRPQMTPPRHYHPAALHSDHRPNAGYRRCDAQPDHEEHDLWAKDESPPSQTLDKNIRRDKIHEYTAQRVVRVTVGRQQLELAGQLSAPVRVDTGIDVR